MTDRLERMAKTAQYLMRKGISKDLKGAVTLARSKQAIIERLQQGTTLFSYQKKSTGETRVAIGTLSGPERCPQSETLLHLVRYYDIQREAIRSFVIQNFKGL